MGDYEDDIPAGGSAFGSGGTPATAPTQSNSSVSRGEMKGENMGHFDLHVRLKLLPIP